MATQPPPFRYKQFIDGILANPARPEAQESIEYHCPMCDSTDLQAREYDFGRSSETGYSDSGVRTTCRNCGHEDDEDGFKVKRRYLSEALAIAADRSSMLPELAHLKALVAHCAEVTRQYCELKSAQ